MVHGSNYYGITNYTVELLRNYGLIRVPCALLPDDNIDLIHLESGVMTGKFVVRSHIVY